MRDSENLSSAKKVRVDKNKCLGCGLCVSLCPEVFELGEDGKSQVKNQKGSCNLKEVVESCPVEAIEVSNEA